MITKEQAIKIAKDYIAFKQWKYDEIEDEKIKFDKSTYINYGKYYEKIRDTYSIPCMNEGYLDPIYHFIVIDAVTGEVHYTITEHGYAEDWE